MESLHYHSHEELITALESPESQTEYRAASEHYQVGWLPKTLGAILVLCGNLVYGSRPSYGKFKAIEVIARIPYQSWEAASYMLLTFCYANEKKAVALSRTSNFSRAAQDNETMHVIVISQLAKKYGQDSLLRHTALPLLFSFVYFSASYLLYLLCPRASFQLNYVFECHALLQYQRFLEEYGEELRKKPILSEFLALYGRHPKSEYEFFRTVMLDEMIHRHQSFVEAEKKNQ